MSTQPLNRWEKFMAKIAGQEVDIEPLNRKEQFYNEIAEHVNSGGGSGGGGVLVINVTETDGAYVCDKTAGEIYAACPAVMFVRNNNGMKTVEFVGNYGRYEEGEYAGAHQFMTYEPQEGDYPVAREYTAASADEYPVSENGH